MTIDLSTMIGKYVKKKDGEKGYVMGQDPFHKNYPYLVCFENRYIYYCNNGTNGDTPYPPHCVDVIVSEWKEPVKHKVDVWVNVYKDGSSGSWPIKNYADAFIRPGRIACKHIQIEVEEGEYDE